MNMYEELINEAVRELTSHSAGGGIKDRAKKLIKAFAGAGEKAGKTLGWHRGFIAMGLADAYFTVEGFDEKTATLIKNSLIKYYDRWIDAGCLITSVENVLGGVALIDLYNITGNIKYGKASDTIAHFILEHKTDTAGSLPYNLRAGNDYIFADMLGMVPPFVFKYVSNFGNRNKVFKYKLLTVAMKQIDNFFSNGMNRIYSLPYHAYKFDTQEKLGLTGWGRACGWMLMGISYGLRYPCADTAAYVRLEKYYGRLIEAVKGYQQKSGLFPWKLGEADNEAVHSDTSATAMILMSALKVEKANMEYGASKKQLKEPLKYSPWIEKGAEALKAEIKDGRVYNALSECIDLGVHPQTYGAYPWSLAPTLSVLSTYGIKGQST